MVLAQRQKYGSVEQNGKPRAKQMHLSSINLQQRRKKKLSNGEKTTSLTSGAGKTGQPLVKE